MKTSTHLAAGAILLAIVGPARAQTPPAPVHKHYDTPATAQAPGPGKPIAPRLQNLGVHTSRQKKAMRAGAG